MKCYLIVIILIIATLLPEETYAGRKFFKGNKSRTRSPSPQNHPANRRPSSTSVSHFNPQNSHFTSGTSATTSQHSSRPTRPNHLPLSNLASSSHSSSHPSPSSSYSSSHPSPSSSHSSSHPSPSSSYSSLHPSSSSGYSSRHSSRFLSSHGSHQSLPPRSRSPSPGPSTSFARIHSSSMRVNPTHHTNQGPRNTFHNTQLNHPATHYQSGSTLVHPPGSPNSNYRPSPSPKQPLYQVITNQKSPPLPVQPSTSGIIRSSRPKSQSRVTNEKIDLPIIDDFISRIEVIDKSAGVNPKDTKRKLRNLRVMKKSLKDDEKQTQQNAVGHGSTGHALKNLNVKNHGNQGCVNDKSPDYACFDYYGFSVYWPPTVARAQQNLRPTQNSANIVDDWAIHGLWPSTRGRNKDRPEKSCNVRSKKFDLRKLNPIVHQLEKVWFTLTLASNPILWEHEYVEHGSCATRSVFINDVLGYFKMSINLHRKINMKAVLESGGFKKDTTKTYREIYNIISTKLAKPHIEISIDLRNQKAYLNEIKICYNYQFHMIDCTTNNPPNSDIWNKEISYLSKDDL